MASGQTRRASSMKLGVNVNAGHAVAQGVQLLAHTARPEPASRIFAPRDARAFTMRDSPAHIVALGLHGLEAVDVPLRVIRVGLPS